LYAYGFRIYFTPLAGVLFAFPSRYWFTIGRSRVFSLGGWSPHLQTGFGYHPLWPDFPACLTIPTAKTCRLLRFRSPLLSESRLISVPRATEMFQFARFASTGLCIQPGIHPKVWVAPFGHLRINARLPAPRSFSQATTSFIACDRQGIHRMHLVA